MKNKVPITETAKQIVSLLEGQPRTCRNLSENVGTTITYMWDIIRLLQRYDIISKQRTISTKRQASRGPYPYLYSLSLNYKDGVQKLATAPNKYPEYTKWLRAIRQKALDIIGRECVQCGFTDLRALQLDHIHGGGTKEHAALGTKGIHMKICKNPEEAKKIYQCLCANCNTIKEWERRRREGVKSK